VGGGKILAPKMCRASLLGSPNLQLQSARCPEKMHLGGHDGRPEFYLLLKRRQLGWMFIASHEKCLVVECSEKGRVIEQTARYSQSLVSMFRTPKN